jgi:signal transduction histidine kinase
MMTSDNIRLIWLNLAIAVAYAAAGAFGLWLGGMVAGNVTLLWPPTGIALAAAYLFGWRIWPGLCLGAFVATASTGAPLGFALITAIGNPLPAMVTVMIVRRWRGGQAAGLHDVTDAVLLTSMGAILTPVLSAGIGVAGLWFNGMIPLAILAKVFTSWYVGDAVGAAVLAPILIALWQSLHGGGGALWSRGFRTSRVSRWSHPQESLALAVATLAFCILVAARGIAHSELLLVAAFPLIVWAALRFDVLITTTLALLIDAFAIGSLIDGLRTLDAVGLSLPIIEVQLVVVAISVTGLILAMAVAERDDAHLTQREAYEQLRLETADLARAREALTLANQDLQRFSEITAHHLQEPARRMASYAERLGKQLAGKLGDAEARLSLDFIGQQARYQQNMLRDVQRYLAAGHPRGKLALTDARQTVAAILARAQDLINAAGAKITVGELPPAWIDAPRLADLFEVLLDNALEHDGAEKSALAGRQESMQGDPLHITIDGERVGTLVRYHVSDNGPGIEVQYRERVFRAFERLQSGGDGTGIGLAIVRRIAESCGGRAWIEETTGGGCCVVFELSAKETA